MTLDELRAQLAALDGVPGDTLVVLAANPEGLHYSPAHVVAQGLYEGDGNAGNVYLADLPGELEEAPVGARAAVVLFPAG